jgi:hypothetical protein
MFYNIFFYTPVVYICRHIIDFIYLPGYLCWAGLCCVRLYRVRLCRVRYKLIATKTLLNC